MANKFYPKGAEKFGRAQIHWENDSLKVGIVSDGYTFSTAHEFLNEVGALVGTAQTLAGKTFAGGVFDADDITFGAVAPGAVGKALIIFKDTGAASTSPLLCYLDEVTGFPFLTNGGDVSIPWSDGPAKIFSLV